MDGVKNNGGGINRLMKNKDSLLVFDLINLLL